MQSAVSCPWTDESSRGPWRGGGGGNEEKDSAKKQREKEREREEKERKGKNEKKRSGEALFYRAERQVD